MSGNPDRPSRPSGSIARAIAIQLAAALAVLAAGHAAQAAAPAASTEPAGAPATPAAGGPSTPQVAPAAPTAPSSAPASSPAGTPQPVQPPPAVEPMRITGPTSVIAGRPVRFAATRAPGTTLEFRWDFEGRGRYGAPTGLASTTHVFRRPGRFLVSLLALAGHGGETVAHLAVVVLAAPAAGHAQARVHRAYTQRHAPLARAAGGASVTIKDFSFGPSTITIHAGDRVTWVNEGPSSHTATAAGVFNTGVLHSGQSASQLFPHAGTFSYRCSIHPFMRATVAVVAASSSNATPSGAQAGSGGAGAAPAQAPGRGSAASTAQGPTLPNTGFSVRGEIIAGLAMLGLGTVLLLLSARRPPPHLETQGRGPRSRALPLSHRHPPEPPMSLPRGSPRNTRK